MDEAGETTRSYAAQKALDGVWGVDINPFAVAIARFRLIVAAVQACGIKRLKQAPAGRSTWRPATACCSAAAGTGLGKGERAGMARTDEASFRGSRDLRRARTKGGPGRFWASGYHVVVGNPPYITVKDRSSERGLPRSLSAPAIGNTRSACRSPSGSGNWRSSSRRKQRIGCGYVGMITANSFMKREFGKKLIEEFFPKIDLTHVIDTSGAYIPGHGTPTVILFGRNRSRRRDGAGGAGHQRGAEHAGGSRRRGWSGSPS